MAAQIRKMHDSEVPEDRYLSVEVLYENGIELDEIVTTYEELSCQHPDAALVQEGLLDFDNILSKSCPVCIDASSFGKKNDHISESINSTGKRR